MTAQRERPTAVNPGGTTSLDLLWEASRRAAEGMDYTHALAKRLVDDFFWADSNLGQLLGEMRWVTECMREPLLQGNADFRKSQLAFWVQATRLLPYFIAVLKTVGPEIVRRATRNQVNQSFGCFMLASLRKDAADQNRALKELQRLASGIAYNKSWFPPDEIAGWGGAVDQAVFEQWREYKGLDRRQIFEHLADNKFAVVSNAIKQRLLDEIRHKYSLHCEYVPDHFWESLTTDAPDPEELLMAGSLDGLLDSEEPLAPYEVGIYTSINRMVKLPDCLSMTDSQIREETIKEAAKVRRISPQQARKDMRKFKADGEKHRTRIARQFPRRKQRGVPRTKRLPNLDEAGV